MTKLILSSSLLLATTSLAFADAPNEAVASHTIPAISNALEYTVAGLYAQGAGELGGDMASVEDVAGLGIGVEGSLGWRATRNLFLGGYANLSGFADRDDSDNGAVSAAVGIKVDWHFLPAAQLDPWVSVGTGLKFMGIEDGDHDRALTGLELAKLQVGLDYRISPQFAVSPVIGASATRYNQQYDEMTDDVTAIDDETVNWTFSVGVLGRWDAFGTTSR